jgi:GTP-binding protein LepA
MRSPGLWPPAKALLVVDATQGVQAQTLANVYLAVDNDLMIVPVINKIDLPSAQPEVAKRKSRAKSAFRPPMSASSRPKPAKGFPRCSRKSWSSSRLQKAIPARRLQALIFDSYYDSYRGVVVLIRIKNGSVKVGDEIY